MKLNWQKDWQLFVTQVTEYFEKGWSAEQVTDKYTGVQIRWQGIVEEMCFAHGRSSVEMRMPKIEIPLKNGVLLKADELSLIVDKEDRKAWENIEPGSKVEFQTKISPCETPYPGLDWSVYDDEAFLLIGTMESKPLRVIQST